MIDTSRGSGGMRVAAWILFVVAGGYGVASSLVAALSVGLVAAGMIPAEAAMLTVMLGVVIYFGLLLWGFAMRRSAMMVASWAAIAGTALAAAALLARG